MRERACVCVFVCLLPLGIKLSYLADPKLFSEVPRHPLYSSVLRHSQKA